jgi:hypothetical protein
VAGIGVLSSSLMMLHHHARKSAHAAPKYNTGRDPNASIMGPKSKLPKGIVPPNAMNHNDNTRARISSSNLLCSTVISAVVVEKYDMPRTKPVMNASGTVREVAQPYVRVSGTWREVEQAWTRVGGVWREWFKAGFAAVAGYMTRGNLTQNVYKWNLSTDSSFENLKFFLFRTLKTHFMVLG